MIDLKEYEFWFVVGSQDLYGDQVLKTVDEHSRKMVQSLDQRLPCRLVWKPVVLGSDEILRLVRAANADPLCAGIVTWMHTFSPSKMWIAGLSELKRPLCHLHTQFNRDIPLDSIDMDFMNLNQSAHGDREHGFIGARMRIPRKVVVGHWEDPAVVGRLSGWMRAAAAFADGKALKVARFGDNMREVAVTEGDKVEAQIKFGWSVNGYGVGDLVESVASVREPDVDALVQAYGREYELAPEARSGKGAERVREQARLELGMRAFLEAGGFGAYTDTFQDLHGLPQLPGLASQRLMADGYGFGAEGDWKTAGVVRAMKVMAAGLGGVSFLEDYTYNLDPAGPSALSAHMLEVCPSIAAGKPRLEVHPLGIGGKADPARLVFCGEPGPAINATLVDMGGRMRMIVNEVDAIEPKPMPKLPVARVLLRPRPDLARAAECWIIAGGAHHTGYSRVVKTEWMRDWAEMAGVEFLLIDAKTEPEELRKEIRWNEVAYRLGI
ncbi:MAG TPA: L-arabinose isomerase [Spirochaetales bacterium]|nr:L-arabinose isomerase [Spirochaetales bacterium]HPM73174.1 L-arabinose isomerase [Spirochaetales bacterium]